MPAEAVIRELYQRAEAGDKAAYVLLLVILGDAVAERDIIQLAKEKANGHTRMD